MLVFGRPEADMKIAPARDATEEVDVGDVARAPARTSVPAVPRRRAEIIPHTSTSASASTKIWKL